MDKINVGFIGCGRISDLHVPGYRDSDQARIFGLCDRDPALLEARRREWGAERVYSDYRQMLADPQIHAVEILTPQVLHEPMTIEALAAGKHVALQKPMSIDLPSVDRMLAAARSSGKVFKVTENYVFYPPILKARDLIREGAIGEPVSIRIKLISGTEGGWEVPAQAWEWRIKEAREGRGFQTFDHGHHLWSTAWFLLGEVERVFGWIDSLDGMIDSPAYFMWKYKGAKRYGSADFVHGEKMRVPSKYYSNDEWIEVTGTAGIIMIRRCTGDLLSGPGLVLLDSRGEHPFDDVDGDWIRGFEGATRNFIAAIRGEEAPRLSGDEAREVLRFSLALQKAARVRREVWVDELDARVPLALVAKNRLSQLKEQGGGLLDRFGLGGGNLKKLAPRAGELTRKMVGDFTPGGKVIPDTRIGLILQGDDLPEQRFGLVIQDNKALLLEGELPENPGLTVTMSPGLWAGVLLKQKRIELAVLQGKIKFTGRAEEAMKLKEAFNF